MDAVTLALIALTTARITRLITTDQVTAPLRLFLMRYLDPEGKLAYMLHCDWCMSMYVGALVSTAAWHYGGTAAFVIPALALSASHITGWLASRTED